MDGECDLADIDKSSILCFVQTVAFYLIDFEEFEDIFGDNLLEFYRARLRKEEEESFS